MSIEITYRCDVCNAPACESIETTLEDFGMGSTRLDRFIEDGWARLVVHKAVRVLSDENAEMAEALHDSRSLQPDAYAIMAAQFQSMAQPFSTDLIVCPACQVGPVWSVVARKLQEALERKPKGRYPERPTPPVLREVPEEEE